MDAETRKRIERLRALRNPNPTDEREVAHAYLGADVFSPIAAIKLRDSLIDLLEKSDPTEWTDEQLGEYGLVRLPRDKDGEVCHIGDIVWDSYGHEWRVYDVRIEYKQVFLEKLDSSTTRGINSCDVTHRPPVTVESVLREFADAVLQDLAKAGRENGMSYNDWINSSNDVITEYATKLRLAEAGER